MTTSRELVTRERILAAARPIVERFTVGKFSMEDVARAAGIARQTIYKHFSGRDDLLIAMYVEQLHDMSAKLAPLVAKRPSEQQLIELFCEELKLAQGFPLFDAMLDPAVAPKMAELVFSSEEMFAERNLMWFPIFRRYTDAGVVDPDLDFAAAVRWITYQQFWILTHPTVLGPDDESRKQYIRDFIIRSFLAR